MKKSCSLNSSHNDTVMYIYAELKKIILATLIYFAFILCIILCPTTAE